MLMTSLTNRTLYSITSQSDAAVRYQAQCLADSTVFANKLHSLAKQHPLALKSIVEQDQGIAVILAADGTIAGYKTSPGFHFADHDLSAYIDGLAKLRTRTCLDQSR